MWTCQFHHMSYGLFQPVVQWLLSVHSVRCRMWDDGHIGAAAASGGRLAPWQLVMTRHWRQNQACMDVGRTHRPLYSVSAPSSLVLPRIHACHTSKSVMGKSQSWVEFKLWREPFWKFNLRCKDLIWNTAIRFAIWSENFADLIWKTVKSWRRIVTH